MTTTPSKKVFRYLAFLLVASLLLSCSSSSELPPPKWSRVEDSTVAQRRFTPEGEYFLGRAVAVRLLDRYGYDGDLKANRYIGLMGAYMAYRFEMPVTYGGEYRFGVLSSEDILAFSTPGGYVFVSRGLLKAVHSEDELAGVIAHELAHLWNKDSIRAVGRSKSTSMLSAIATLAAGFVGGQGIASALLQTFEGAVDFAVTDLVNHGFSREQEMEADRVAVRILQSTGYHPDAYLTFVRRVLGVGEKEVSLRSTHPSSSERVEQLEALVGAKQLKSPTTNLREERFAAALDR
jgi:predicted Zn-dependent protease